MLPTEGKGVSACATLAALNEFAEYIHQGNVERGFYEEDVPLERQLLLIHEEVSEACSADRADSWCAVDDIKRAELDTTLDDNFREGYNKWVKGTVDEEFADIFIRLLDAAHYQGINLAEQIRWKLRRNGMRAFKHGKRY